MPYQRLNYKQKSNPGQKKTFSGPTKAAILRSAKPGWLNVVTPYDPGFVKEIKEKIQPSHRKWNPDAGYWEVNEIFLEELVPMLQKYYDEVETDLTTETKNDNPFTAVLEVIAEQDLEKIYKTLAFAVHPDRGGSEQSMKLLNEAYQKRKTA